MAQVPKNRRRGSLAAALLLLTGRRIAGPCEYRIAVAGNGGDLYLLGEPYLWTADIAKAFVFGKAEDADQIVRDFPHLFGQAARVVVTEATM